MAFLSIESSNPKFSYIIQKNPTNPAIAKPIRQGTAIGWFANEQKYCVRFVDPPQEMSYNKAEYEYLDVTALSSPAAYSNLIRDFFSGLLKKENEDDTDQEVSNITLGFIKCSKRNLEHFTKFFPEVSYAEKAKTTYEVVFCKIPGSLRKLLHLANLFCIFMMVADDDFYVDINEDVVNKYLTSLQVVKVPYYIANLFKVQFLKTKALFTKFAPTLQEACTEEVTFEFGSVLDARKRWIESNLTINNNIVDIGAGEDLNYAYLSRNITGIYYPVDRNEEARKSITKRIDYKKLDKVSEPLADWNEVKELLDSDTEVILTEVLEHNTLKEAKALLVDVLHFSQVKRVICTVPNKDFNQYYLLNTEFRHEDHKWEPTDVEVTRLLTEVCSKAGCLVSYRQMNIGDRIKEISPTIGFIIEKE
jgi:small RNA 2'-O-methyltransferase